MPTLWLTYAWKDNETNDVDFVVGRLMERGIEVRLDRTQLLAGRRLWQQLDERLRETDLDGWAICVTKNSLTSEPCQEELAYALDRALRTKGSQFPLIGIFPERLDRSIVPSALATRLYVDLKDASWSQAVADSLTGRNTQAIPTIPTVHAVFYERAGRCKLEIRPRDGHWYPARTLVPESEFDTLAFVYRGPPDKPEFEPGMFQDTEISGGMDDGSRWKGRDLHEQIDHSTSLYVIFKGWPTSVVVGGGRDLYRVYPAEREVIKIPVIDGRAPWH